MALEFNKPSGFCLYGNLYEILKFLNKRFNLKRQKQTNKM